MTQQSRKQKYNYAKTLGYTGKYLGEAALDEWINNYWANQPVYGPELPPDEEIEMIPEAVPEPVQAEILAEVPKEALLQFESGKREFDTNTWIANRYHFSEYTDNINLDEDNRDNIEGFIRRAIAENPVYNGKKISIILVKDDDTMHSTAFKDVNEALDKIKDDLNYWTREYDGDFVVNDIIIEYIEGVQGSFRSFIQADNTWLIINPITRKNCFWVACAISAGAKSNAQLVVDKVKQQQAGKQLKKAVAPVNNEFADEESYQKLADYKGMRLKIYNNIFESRTIEPANLRSNKEIEVQFRNGHAFALIRKTEFSKIHGDAILKACEAALNHKVAKAPKEETPKLINKFSAKKTYIDDEEDFEIVRQNGYKIKHEETEDFDEDGEPIIKYYYWKEQESPYFNKYAAWDLETCKVIINGEQVQKAYAAGIAIGSELEKFEYKDFWGLDCINNFLDYLADNIDKFAGYTFYAHNGGKFDMNVMLREGLLSHHRRRSAEQKKGFKINGKDCIELNNSWIGFSIYIDDKFISFRDSLRMLPAGLDKLCKEFNVVNKKLTETVDHNIITKDNYHTFPQLPAYLKNDCYGLLEILNNFSRQLYKEFQINMRDCFTGASLSKKVFYKKYYNQNKYPVYKLTKKQDKLIRDGYFGGRVECFHIGKFEEKVYYYDFTSLYPDQGRKPLPYSPPEDVEFNHEEETPADIINKFEGHVTCMVLGTEEMLKAANCHKPIHGCLLNNRLCFPYFNKWTKITLFSEEVKLGLKYGYKYKFINGVQFKLARFMKSFFEDAFVKKAQEKENGNNALSNAYKIIANSGYGFWGTRTEDRDGVIVGKASDNSFKQYFNDNKLLSVGRIEDYNFIRVLKELKINDNNVAVAAAISSYARMRTWNLINDIYAAGGKVFYCDTDSVITNIDLSAEESKQLKKKYQWDGCGKELGTLKNECEEKVEDSMTSLVRRIHKVSKENEITKEQKQEVKNLVNQQKAHDGELYFDKLVVAGCKMYALQKTLVDGTSVEINKCKGYSQRNFWDQNMIKFTQDDNGFNLEVGGYIDYRLKFDTLENLLVPGTKINQQQMQFRCGKADYVKENNNFEIKVKNVTKAFRVNYTKGKVLENGIVNPLVIE